MIKLKNLLDDSTKARRLRRIYLNIHITFLTWLVECLGFFLIFLGSFILGYENSNVTLCLQITTVLIYIVVVPGMYLVNGNTSKDQINDSSFYIALHKILQRRNNKVEQEMGNEEQDGAEEGRHQNGDVIAGRFEEDE